MKKKNTIEIILIIYTILCYIISTISIIIYISYVYNPSSSKIIKNYNYELYFSIISLLFCINTFIQIFEKNFIQKKYQGKLKMIFKGIKIIEILYSTFIILLSFLILLGYLMGKKFESLFFFALIIVNNLLNIFYIFSFFNYFSFKKKNDFDSIYNSYVEINNDIEKSSYLFYFLTFIHFIFTFLIILVKFFLIIIFILLLNGAFTLGFLLL
jgi:hypothetical protein